MGANGAGKSSLFNILASLDDAFEGEIRIDGMNIQKNKRQIRGKLGYVPGRVSFVITSYSIHYTKLYDKFFVS